MIAKKAKEENFGICPICLVEDKLPNYYEPEKANICKPCYLKLCPPLQFDEYDLRPDELTKEMFAEKAGVGVRAVELWVKNGKIASEKIRRRITDKVRSTLIFKLSDVENFLNESVKLPSVEMEKTKNENLERLSSSQMFVAEKLVEAVNGMQKLSEQFTKQLPAPPPDEIKPFMSVKTASDYYGLAQAEIRRLIESDKLTGYKGSHGETLVSRKEIENL